MKGIAMKEVTVIKRKLLVEEKNKKVDKIIAKVELKK
jgi:hypothetical protein